MKFAIGTRVKKVRGERMLGITGTVVGFNVRFGEAMAGLDMLVQPDCAWVNGLGAVKPATEVAAVQSASWEPVIDDTQTAELGRELIRALGLDVHAAAEVEA